jgi:hypothetical protein
MLKAFSIVRKTIGYELFRLAVFLIMTASVASGQATQGSIFGNVTDSSGAVVPHAKVTVTSVERGVSRGTVSSDAGEYRVPDLELGSYVVSVEKSGFKMAESPATEITVKAIIRVDLQLQPGAVTQTVQVQGSPPLIRTGSAEVSNVIGLQELQQLPVLSRNLLSVASLTAGTNQGNASGRQAATSGAEVVVNGTPPEGNNFILDGVSDNMEFSGTIATRPPMDSLQEFAVQVSQYSAEFGRGAGGLINMSLKSGTNRVHGFAYDYLQNNDLNAQPYNFTGVNQPVVPLHRNQYGAGAGGPILKNRLFWFGNWEGLQYSTSALGQYTVPTAAEKTGDFSNSGFTIYDPATAAPDPANPSQIIRQQFPGNIIPVSRISPAGSGLMSYYPNPNYTSPTPGVLTNYLLYSPSTQTGNSFVGKIDANLSSTNIISVHYVQQVLHYASSNLAPAVTGTTTSQNGINVGITYTHIFSPRLLNEARASYNLFQLPSVLNDDQNFTDQYKIPGWSTGPEAKGFPSFGMGNISSLASTREISWVQPPLTLTENTFQYLDTVSWQKGKHAIKFGVELDHLRLSYNNPTGGGGSIGASGAYTTQVVGGAVTSPRNGVADMLLGDLSTLNGYYDFVPRVVIKTYRSSEFIQDDWRLTPSLTVNLGLRYDIFTPYHEEYDRVQNFDLSTGTVLVPSTARSYMESAFGFPNGNLPNHWQYVSPNQVYPSLQLSNISPRLGLAYAVSPKIIFRGGYGIFYDQTTANSFMNGRITSVTVAPNATIATPLTFAQGLPGGGIAATVSSDAYAPYNAPINRPNPYSAKYNADVQWSPHSTILFDIGYDGAISPHFPTLVPGNTPLTPGPGTLQTRQLYPNFGFFWRYLPVDNTNYNGLTATVTANNIGGFFLKSAFTFSKALGYGTGTDEQITDPNNFRYDYGPIDYDITNRWVTSAIYRIPVPASFGTVSRSLLGGWESSGIFTLESGFPLTPTSSVTLNLGSLGGTGQRSNVIPHVSLYPGHRTINNWFNKAAFQDPEIYTWGNAGKNILRGPRLNELDFALQKRFALPWERHSVVIRMETTNLFNHPSWGTPASNFDASNFGIIQSTQNSMRVAQAVLRYQF